MQKGLESAIKEKLPNVEHRMCARHVLANWSQKYRGLERKNCFWRCAKSTFESQLNENLDYMKLLGEECLDKLMYYNPERWNKVYMKYTTKCDIIYNNMTECFNSWLLAARHKTVINMLEEIRVKMMKRVGQMREFCVS
ncbi:uncharacterized protein LOC132043098 [Lycium ferocissimum]|uniref:uncharacterized protein LOC132043098 n=1 Tax=Lycium ferocissimum TaxID=112874 RepID=UPI00281564EF|nr:uncharacterized protein LOC132043098 [Lycium ferocissimum]